LLNLLLGLISLRLFSTGPGRFPNTAFRQARSLLVLSAVDSLYRQGQVYKQVIVQAQVLAMVQAQDWVQAPAFDGYSTTLPPLGLRFTSRSRSVSFLSFSFLTCSLPFPLGLAVTSLSLQRLNFALPRQLISQT